MLCRNIRISRKGKTLLAVLKQAPNISIKIVGEQRKIVITLDMQLYEKAPQLEKTKKWLLHIWALHTVMCVLRAIEPSVEKSSLDNAWVESDI